MNVIAETPRGRLAGFTENGVSRFFGIPYAAPPTGRGCWRAPEPPSSWPGVRQAVRFGAACPQTVGAMHNRREDAEDEDCLYLNVWTSTLDPAARRPVMVWIHGGGNLGGSGSEDAYDGSGLAEAGVTVVTFNYRLGAFGYLAHPNAGANFAVLDQVAALEWVRANIAAFGGESGNVTVFGQSAGAVAVRSLLSCPAARGLFHRAILQSGGFEAPAFAPSWSLERAKDAAEALFDRLGSSDIDVLRALPCLAVKAASHELSGIFPTPGNVHTPANLVWMPVMDGKVLVADGFPGWPPDVPVMLGWVENEARYFIKPSGTYTREILANMARSLCGPVADSVLASLDRESMSPYAALDKLYTAIIWTEPALETLRRFALLSRRVFGYHFTRLSPGAVDSGDLVKHGAETRYVFGSLTRDGVHDETDDRVSDLMRQAWVNFARSGEPSAPEGLHWPAFESSRPVVARIDDSVTFEPVGNSDLMTILAGLRLPSEDFR